MIPDYEYQYANLITCPYCGYQNPDSWEYADIKGDCDYECPKCEKTSKLYQPEIEIKYTTSPRSNHCVGKVE